jgi:hypothetical protein
MTQPTTIYFGPDGGPKRQVKPIPKVYLRALLYSTAVRGQVIECMFARLRRGETTQNFNIWVYRDRDLHRGSGIFVPHDGVAYDHHFMVPADGSRFEFLTGQYQVEVFAVLAGSGRPQLLFSTELEVSPEMAMSLAETDLGLFFDWGPDAGRYQAHVREQPEPDFPDFFREFLKSQVSNTQFPNKDSASR